jgi:WD40 repeat protein
VICSCKGFANPTCIKYCKKRKEVFIGYVDGTISVYQIVQNLEQIQYTGSFRTHRDAIHSLYFFSDLDLFASSGFDSVLKLWKAPEEWNKKLTVTASMIGGMKEDNLSTIKEEKDDLELPSQDSNHNLLKHRITAWGAGPGDKVVESLLQQM